jgi:ATP-dependent Clp protease ATP-binding subunit ClpX
MDGVKLKFQEDALKAVAGQALKRNAGARGLRAILESAMLDIMYDVPSRPGIKEVVITSDVIEKGESPLTVYEKEAELA